MSEEVLKIWEKIQDKVLEHLKDTDFLCLVAHGSFAEGINNKNSDFDILVLCRGDIKERTEVIVVNDLEVDLDFLSEETLKTQLESLDDLLMPGLMPPFASRLKHAVILIDKGNVAQSIIDMAGKYQPSGELMDWYSRRILGYYYDAVGAMASGNYATSIHTARIGASHALTGILLKQGELYTNKKWLCELMKRVPAPQELFLRLMGLDAADKEQALQCIRDFNNLISEFERTKEQK